MEARSLGEDIWSVDGPDIVFAGARMHTRMTIVRLTGGSLWVHSPIKLGDDTRRVIDEIGGEVRVLIAPNKFHHMYVAEWQAAWPQAAVFAEAAVRRKVPALAQAEELTDETPAVYADVLDQVQFRGSRMFEEAVFFHKPSGTLILTDLMINLRGEHIAWLPGLFLRFEQVLFPNGGVPRLYRWTSNRKRLRTSVSKVRSWAPKQITFCHGELFEESAGELIDRNFGWLD